MSLQKNGQDLKQINNAKNDLLKKKLAERSIRFVKIGSNLASNYIIFQEEIRAIKKRLMGAKMKVLKRDGFMLPVGYDLDEMLINTFDVESWRSEFKNPIPKLKISL